MPVCWSVYDAFRSELRILNQPITIIRHFLNFIGPVYLNLVALTFDLSISN